MAWSRSALRTPIACSLLCLGHLNRLVAFGTGHACLAHPLVFGHITASLLDRFRGGFLADRVDVSRLVRDVGDVHVDQLQANLGQFRFERSLNVLQKLVAIAVDLFDAHRGDDLTQLAKNNFFGLLADLADGQAQQANSRLLHHRRFRADGHGEHTRHIDADVLKRQRTTQRNFDLDRLETQIGIVLEQRQHELGAGVDRLGRLARTLAASPDHQHAVTGATFVLLHQQNQNAERQDDETDGNQAEIKQPAIGNRLALTE